MKFKTPKNKLWFNIFIRIAVIFAAFVLIISLSNITLLVGFFSEKEKTALKEQIIEVAKLDFDDKNAVIKALSAINEKYNFDVEIFDDSGYILYTTHGSQMMDYFTIKNDRFSMTHEKMMPSKTEKLSNGITFQIAERRFDHSEYLLCQKQVSANIFAEVRIQKQLISNSANIANEFIIIISIICFLISIVWVLLFARKFSQPIAEMNEITKNMAELNFERKLKIDRKDEIGQLATSINYMSDSLSSALTDLKTTNAKLLNDIELERRLDVMRREFVANVSHELKTPISIISGYAEGLMLNVNSRSKEEYCNTIIDESKRMNRLVLSILELSRYESGQIQINRQNFNISAVCDEMLGRIFAKKDVTTKNGIPAGTSVCADPVQIEQVIKSFLENAASHTPDGGSVTVESEEKGDSFRISVFNTGSHIDDSLMPQIWQSFYRGDTSRKRESSRFGLGLSIVTAIMKLHNRPCGVYNTENGVCFWFEVEKSAPDDESTI